MSVGIPSLSRREQHRLREFGKLVSEPGPGGLDRVALRADVLKVLPEWARDRVVLMGIRGSHAHGTYIPPEDEHGNDDVDVFVVTAQPVDWYLGLASYSPKRKAGWHFETSGEELDVVVYDVRKFAYLLAKGNPNVHNWLWSPDDCYLYRGEASAPLFDARRTFLSQRILQATAGYASGQLYRMTHFQRNGYMGAKRKKLVERHGYDVKNAAHCVRLLYQGIELCRTGDVNVRWVGPPLDTLIQIKKGEWSLTDVRTLAEDLFDEFNGYRDDSDLPAEPDAEACDRAVRDVIRRGEAGTAAEWSSWHTGRPWW